MKEELKTWTKGLSNQEIKITQQSMEKLRKMIESYENDGIPFEKIFNNDVIKYDVFGKNFYTFKAHGADKTQLRILYRFVRENDTFRLECHKVEIKRRKGKEYIKDFENYVKKY
jgi:hypothetical protein